MHIFGFWLLKTALFLVYLTHIINIDGKVPLSTAEWVVLKIVKQGCYIIILHRCLKPLLHW
jgi:hypothetical protein